MIIYFDFDGTLVDIRDKYYALYAEFMSGRKGIQLGQDHFWALKRRKDGDALILHRSGLGELPPQVFRDFIREHVETSRFLEKDVLFPGVHDFLHAIQREHSCRIVTSRRNHDQFFQQIQRLQVRECFDEFVFAPKSGSRPDGRTDKAFFLKDCFNSSDQVMIVGDTEEDIVTGQQLNVRTVAVTSGIRHRAFLAALGPDRILSSVTELTACLPPVKHTRHS